MGPGDINDRANAMMRNGDIGFAYYNMVRNLIEKYGKDAYSMENILDASDLPTQKELETKTLEAMTMNLYDLKPGPFSRYASLLINIGIEMYTKRGLDGKKSLFTKWFQKDRYFPDFVFNDTFPDTSGVNFQDALRKIAETGNAPFAERIAVFEFIEGKMMEFVNICGV